MKLGFIPLDDELLLRDLTRSDRSNVEWFLKLLARKDDRWFRDELDVCSEGREKILNALAAAWTLIQETYED